MSRANSSRSLEFYGAVGCLSLFVGIGLLSFLLPIAAPAGLSTDSILLPPLSQGHFLGTDHLGRDVAILLYNASGFHLILGVGVLCITALIGIPAGILSGYKHFAEWKIRLWSFLFFCFAILAVGYYLFSLPFRPVNLVFVSLLLLFLGLLLRFMFREVAFTINIKKGLDTLIDFMNVLPRFLIVFVALAILPTGMLTLILVLGLTSWVPLARILRADTMKLNAQPYVEAGIAMGFTHKHLLIKYILPALWPLVFTLLSYGFASTVLAEAALGFLDMGASADWVTWGRLILYAKSSMHAWWLLLCPLVCIFVLSSSLYIVATQWQGGKIKNKYNFELVS